ncbi:hypothetical protein CK503_03170 [Aliifodinibius salipaludis]|uniref:Uncharacterized protein n=1 Tax=Fodinibius salipaludis TaxID=2032627 RepID=A0A2A2GDZ2_9BACT|nr:hypothetical protein [Aliifodinibius salipaludis]PAU95214.1 hypothetical protein CK503_03170 [Aliifodinibius salipaludis]
MERLQNPFSLYDFLGYLIPGATGIYIFLFMIAPEKTTWSGFFDYYSLDRTAVYIPLIISSYIMGHIISFLSSVTVEKYSVWSLGYPSKYLLGIDTKGYWGSIKKESKSEFEKVIRSIFRVAMGVFLAPIAVFDSLLGWLFYGRFLYARELDDFTKNTIISYLDNNFEQVSDIRNPDETGDVNDQNFFKVIYHYCLERVKYQQNKFQNYNALYGFLRALSFLFVVIFWSMIFSGVVLDYIFLLSFVVVASIVCYMGYNKFSRRFTLEVLMAFISIQKEKTSDSFATVEDTSRFSEWVYTQES